MKKYENIIIKKDVLENIIFEECKKVPGTDMSKTYKIIISENNTVFDIEITPMNSFYNLYSIAKELQSQIYYHLTKQFDINNIIINIYLIREM